jgi:SAM-dependent methyltransferase
MHDHLSHSIRKQVQSSYSVIASEFSATRQKPWPEFEHFLTYVRPESKILDLGCGNGRLAGLLSAKAVEYLGIDNNSALLALAREQHPDDRFKLADMVGLDLPEGAFDTLFCVAVFHHLPDKKTRRQAASHMHRVLREDGILILTVWNLFQWKYVEAILSAVFSFVLHLGFRYAWNDTWISWGERKIKRYYHAFLPKELLRYFSLSQWKIEDFYFTRKGKRVHFWRCFNIVLIARKI